MAKRGNHEGSIRKLKDGSGFRGAIRLGYDDNGNPIRKFVKRKRKDEVQDELRALARRFEQNLPITTKAVTVGQFLNTWLEDHVRHVNGAGTYGNYSQHVRTYIRPLLGKIVLEKLNAQDVQKFLNRIGSMSADERNALSDDGMILKTDVEQLTPSTVKRVHATLKSALTRAVEWKRLSHNPAKDAKSPKQVRFTPKPLNLQQAEALLKAVEGDRLESFFVLASLGLRKGELLGVSWTDISWVQNTNKVDAGVLYITKSLKKVKGKGTVLGEVKTAGSRRSINLPSFVIAALLRRREIQEQEKMAAGDKWVETGLIFTCETGNKLNPDRPGMMLDAALAKAGIPHVRMHDLRHTAATLLIAKGIPLKSVSAILGHSTIQITADVYGHLNQEMRDDVTDALDAMFAKRAVNDGRVTPITSVRPRRIK